MQVLGKQHNWEQGTAWRESCRGRVGATGKKISECIGSGVQDMEEQAVEWGWQAGG